MAASSVIGSLRVALSLGTADFEAGANKASAIAKSKGREIEGAFGGARKAIEGLFAAFAIGALTEQIKKSLDYAGSLAEVSRTLGVTTQQLQEYRFAAGQTGVAQEQLETGLTRLNIAMGRAEAGSQAQVKAFQSIGISIDQLKGKNAGDVFKLVADGLSKVTDRAQRAAVEVVLFGKSGAQLDNLLAGGSARLNALAESAKELGVVLSDQQIQGAEETAHKLEAVKNVLAAQIAGVVADNARSILSLSTALASLTGSIVKFLGSNPQLALGIIGALAGARVGGVPGALIGGAAGALAGAKVAQIRDDGNMDVKFRAQQFLTARQQYLNAPDTGGRVLPGVGVSVDRQDKLKEYQRQAALYQAAKAQASAPKVTPTATNLPQFLGTGGKKGAGAGAAPQDRNEQDAFQFAQQQREMDLQILQAKQSLSHDIGEQAQLALQSLDVQTAIKNADIDHKVAQAQRDAADGKITASTLAQIEAEAAIERGKQAELTTLQRKAILDQRDEALLRESIDLDTHGYDIRKSLLQKQADLAQTAAERRTIELQLLDLQYKEQRIMLERIANESKNADEVDKANQDLRALDANYALDRASTLKSTEGPLQQYLDSLPTTSAKWTEALQSVAVDGFGAITNAADTLAGKIVKVGGIFGDVTRTILADLLKIELQKLIIAPLAKLLDGFIGGGSLGGGGFSFSAASAGAGSVGDIILGGLKPHALGGSMRLGGNMGTDRNVVSVNGVPIAKASYGEQLSIGNGGGGGGNVTVHQTFQFEGVAVTQDQFVRGLVATRASTITAIKEAQRRK